VNSISLVFVPVSVATLETNQSKIKKAYFAGGCFWGVDYWLRKEKGVIDIRSGYMGGHTINPTYQQVCTGTTGHTETVEVTYDPNKVSYETLAKLFFEIHDPTQLNGQGPDIGYQYRSVIFYVDDTQKAVAERLIEQLRKKGFDVATSVEKAGIFWKAEEYHQNYYGKTGKLPYCHSPTKRF
jgi:peptide methionine sulfoxide reductase msrA/msrB